MFKQFTSVAAVATLLCLPLAGCDQPENDTDTVPLAPGVQTPDADLPPGEMDVEDMNSDTPNSATIGENANPDNAYQQQEQQ